MSVEELHAPEIRDVLEDGASVGAGDTSGAVGCTGDGGVEDRHPAVRIGERDAIGPIDARIGFRTRGSDEFESVSEEEFCEDECVDSYIQESAAREFRIGDARNLFHWSAQVGGQQDRGADDSGVERLPDCPDERQKTGPHRFCDKATEIGGAAENRFRLSAVDGKGFFAKDVFTEVEAEHHIGEMLRVRGSDIHQIDIWIGCEFPVGTVCGAGAPFGRECRCAVDGTGSDGRENEGRHLLHGFSHDGRDIAAAENSDSCHFIPLERGIIRGRQERGRA